MTTSTNQEIDLFHSLLSEVVISWLSENTNIDLAVGSQNDAGFPKLSVVVRSEPCFQVLLVANSRAHLAVAFR